MPLEQWIPSINTDFAVSDDGLGSLYGNMSKIKTLFSHTLSTFTRHTLTVSIMNSLTVMMKQLIR